MAAVRAAGVASAGESASAAEAKAAVTAAANEAIAGVTAAVINFQQRAEAALAVQIWSCIASAHKLHHSS